MVSDTNNNDKSIDVEVLHSILAKLVNFPEDINIVRSIDERGVLITVSVNTKDMPIVIGREGRMVDSIRYVIKGIGLANNMTVRVYFLEPDGSFKYNDKIGGKGGFQTSPNRPSNDGKNDTKSKPAKVNHTTDFQLN